MLPLSRFKQVFVDELSQLTVTKVTDEELSRAKNMLKSMMFTQLESRLITCEDIAKQVMVYGGRRDAKSLCLEIDKVNADDLMNIARKMLVQNPTVSIIGYDVSNVPTYQAIKAFKDSYLEEVMKKATR